MPTMKTAELLNPFDAPVYYRESCVSTMNEAASLSDAAHGTVVYSSFQTSGRGRGQNRSWDSPIGESLLFTIVVDPSRTVHPPVRIPLICALTLEKMFRTIYGIECLLKWPNDLLVNGKKISGILCEYRGGRILSGIGINIKQRTFPEEIGERASSMELEGASGLEAPAVLEAFLNCFREKLENPAWKEEAESLLYGKDRILEVLEGDTVNPKQKRIRILGLDDEGFLKIEDVETGRKKSLQAGEISFQGFGNFR